MALSENTKEVALDFEQARFNMVEQQIRPWEVLDPEVLRLLTEVRREEFVPPAYKPLAFADVEIPLSRTAKMFPPKMEAKILQEVGIRNNDRVLEIGTGSGYMAALLAEKATDVTTVEIDKALAETARQNLERAGYANVHVEVGDGSRGWAPRAPYDVIIVSASVPEIPAELLGQLKVGGRLAAIVGAAPTMSLEVVSCTAEGSYTTVKLLETVVEPLLNAKKTASFEF